MKLSAIRMAFFLLLVSTTSLYAFTTGDYYKAALQLYNAKNYAQATQYFDAALSLDPNNAGALQGRANCYYAQGQYPQALADYQKVLSLEPSNAQLSQFIQSLQAKVGASPGSPVAPGVPAPAASASFDQGVGLYQQRQYAAAVPDFQKAVQENPNDSKAYYYLGATQMMMGDNKDAAVALALSNKLEPNPSIAGYVNQLKSRLTPEDQQWVDSQISSQGGPKAASLEKSKSFGFRLEPAVSLINLADFDADAQARKAFALYEQGPPLNDGSVSFSASVPAGSPNIGLEPVVRLGSNFEIGLPLAIFPVGTVTDTLSSSNGSDTSNSSYAISAFSIGLDARYLFMTGDLQPFVGAGVLFVPISLEGTDTTVSSGVTTNSSGSFAGTAVGGQIQLGVDWHLGDSFVISPYAAYQFATANSFPGTYTSDPGGTSQTDPGQLMVVPNPPYGNNIGFVKDGDTPPTDAKPLTVDLSGITGGLMISAFF